MWEVCGNRLIPAVHVTVAESNGIADLLAPIGFCLVRVEV